MKSTTQIMVSLIIIVWMLVAVVTGTTAVDTSSTQPSLAQEQEQCQDITTDSHEAENCIAASVIPSNDQSHNDNHNHKSCQSRAENGECSSTSSNQLQQSFMFSHCPMECLNDDQLGTVGYFEFSTMEKVSSSSKKEEDTTGIEICQDLHSDCFNLAEQGHCRTRPNFMQEQCAQTCRICFPEGITKYQIGVGQTIPQESKTDPIQVLKFLQQIESTSQYMSETVMANNVYSTVRYDCYNYDEHCTALAIQGACSKPFHLNDEDDDEEDGEMEMEDEEDDDEEIAMYHFMMQNCAPTCQTCEGMIMTQEEMIIQECTPDYETNIFDENDMHVMFQRIVGEIPFKDDDDEGAEGVVPSVPFPYTVTVHSRPLKPEHDKPGVDLDSLDYHVGPWIITLDNFLTDEECDRLIELGALEGYQRSELEEDWGKDEEEIRKERESEDAYRTSTNSWCMDECYKDPVAKRVMEKIANVTGVPESYSEYLQLLRYVPGQYYKEHHDYIEGQEHQNPGPRILTFYLYLNDVEEGGGTRFTDLYGDDTAVHMDIQPKKGRALVWPSVFVQDPHERDDRTYHEALTVLQGSKYGANAWLHLRNFKNDPCDYEQYYKLTEEEEEYDEEEDDEEQAEYDEEEEDDYDDNHDEDDEE